MVAGLQDQRCDHHPDRYGHATCMSCRRVVCQECATEWDGINYCVRCLSEKRRSTRERPAVAGWIALALLSACLFYLAVEAMVWGTVFAFA